MTMPGGKQNTPQPWVLLGWWLALGPGAALTAETAETAGREREVVDLAELAWHFRAGDDPAWSRVEVNEAAWSRVDLPHRWSDEAAATGEWGWYRVRLPAPAGPALLDLGVVGYFCEVFVDGERVYASGDMAARVWQPLHLRDVVVLEGAGAVATERVVAVRVRAAWGAGGMIAGPWRLEPTGRHPAETRWFAAFRARWTAAVAILACMALWTFLLGLLLWHPQRPRGLVGVVIFLAAVCGYYAMSSLWLPDPRTGFSEMQSRVGGAVLAGLAAVMVGALGPGLYGLLNQRWPRRVGWGLAVLLAFGTGLSVLSSRLGDGRLPGEVLAWLGAVALVAGLVVRALWRGWRENRPHSRALGGALLLVVAGFWIDLATVAVPWPLQVGEWLPVGPSRAALLSCSEAGLVVLVFALGLSVLDHVLRRERRIRELSGDVLASSEKERLRLSRELHDGLAPLLQSLRLQTRLRQRTAQVAGEAGLAELGAGLEQSVQELRRAVRGQRSVWLEGRGLVEALRAYAAETYPPGCGVRVVIDLPEALSLPPLLEAELFRFWQEGLRNAVRHGDASRVICRAEPKEAGWVFTCRDNGAGMAAGRGEGVGLRSLRERAELLQGEMAVESVERGGVDLRWWFPAAALRFVEEVQHG